MHLKASNYTLMPDVVEQGGAAWTSSPCSLRSSSHGGRPSSHSQRLPAAAPARAGHGSCRLVSARERQQFNKDPRNRCQSNSNSRDTMKPNDRPWQATFIMIVNDDWLFYVHFLIFSEPNKFVYRTALVTCRWQHSAGSKAAQHVDLELINN